MDIAFGFGYIIFYVWSHINEFLMDYNKQKYFKIILSNTYCHNNTGQQFSTIQHRYGYEVPYEHSNILL